MANLEGATGALLAYKQIDQQVHTANTTTSPLRETLYTNYDLKDRLTQSSDFKNYHTNYFYNDTTDDMDRSITFNSDAAVDEGRNIDPTVYQNNNTATSLTYYGRVNDAKTAIVLSSGSEVELSANSKAVKGALLAAVALDLKTEFTEDNTYNIKYRPTVYKDYDARDNLTESIDFKGYKTTYKYKGSADKNADDLIKSVTSNLAGTDISQTLYKRVISTDATLKLSLIHI